MLGMSCEFTENCRCLDCQVTIEAFQIKLINPDELTFLWSFFFINAQSRYFDCDDDDDSDTFSNLSAVIEAEEFSTRADDADTLYYCNGDDEYCSYGDGTCEDSLND